MSTGLLLLRVVVGLTFWAHGSQKLFKWWGSPGLRGCVSGMQHLGYEPAFLFAITASSIEVVGGLFFAAGFLTPLASAAIVGTMVNAVTSLHADKGFWETNHGYEYMLVFGTVGAALAFTGAGRFSIDHALGLTPHGSAWGLGATAVGVATGVSVEAWRRHCLARRSRTVPAETIA